MKRIAAALLFAISAFALGQDLPVSDTPIKLPVLGLGTLGTVTSVDVSCAGSLLVACSGGPITTSGTFPFVDPTLTTGRLICTGSGTTPTLCAFNSGEGLAYSGNTVILDINGLTADAAPTSTYYVPFYSVGSAVNKKVTLDNLLKAAFVALSTKATPIGADLVALQDSAASNVPKVSTISSLPMLSQIYSSAAQITFSDTVTATDIIGVASTGVTVPAATMGTNGQCVVQAEGGYINNSGGNSTLALVITFGGTTFYSSITGNIATGTGTRAWQMRLRFFNVNSAAVNRMEGDFRFSVSNVAATGRGAMNAGAGDVTYTFSSAGTALTVNTANAQDIRATIAMGTATTVQTFTTDKNTVSCIGR